MKVDKIAARCYEALEKMGWISLPFLVQNANPAALPAPPNSAVFNTVLKTPISLFPLRTKGKGFKRCCCNWRFDVAQAHGGV